MTGRPPRRAGRSRRRLRRRHERAAAAPLLLALARIVRLLATEPARRRRLRSAFLDLGRATIDPDALAGRGAEGEARERAVAARRAQATARAELVASRRVAAAAAGRLVGAQRRRALRVGRSLRLGAAAGRGRGRAAASVLRWRLAIALAVWRRRTASALAAAAAASLVAGRATGVAARASARTGARAGRASARTGARAGRAVARVAGRLARVTARALRAVARGAALAGRASARGVGRVVRAVGRLLAWVVGALAAPPDPRLPAWRRFLRPLAAALGLTMLAGAAAGLPTAAMLGGSVKTAGAGLPDLSELRPIDQPERTQVYDKDGRLIEVLRDEQDRIVVPLSKVAKVLQQAVLAAEDERFYDHRGIDDRGIVRALVANLVGGGAVQGGSTITQQLVRNAYPDLKDRSIERKVKEAALAAQLESRLSKDQILEDYLNIVYFGAGYYGVEAASRGYFGKHASELGLAEAALLAGVIREPETANPRERPDLARDRRDTVLRQMASLGTVPPAEVDRAASEPLGVRPPRQIGGRYPWFVDALKRELLADPRLGRTVAERNRQLYEGGLRISTTLDTTAQRQAEEAVARWRPASGPDVALVAIDPRDGAVRALVGGRDFRKRKFNLAVQGERQAGSAFKPFVLAAAMADGVSPASLWESSGFSDRRVCGAPWTVANYEGRGSGRISVREATWRSVNGVYARLMARLCPAKVVRMAERLGVDVPERQALAPSIALGAANVTPFEMASAYATLANLGVRQRPVLVTRVARHGRTLFENRPEGERRLEAPLAYEATDVLKGVLRRGTGRAAALDRPAAGKTGTTQDYRDAWFVGYTRQLATAVWMGYPGRELPMLDVGGIRVTGGSYPARIWHDFMVAALAGQPALDWERPPGELGFSVLPPTRDGGGDRGGRDRRGRDGRGGGPSGPPGR